MNERYCRAPINYFSVAEGPVPVEVDIFDGRSETNLAWSENGFELQSFASAVRSWSDAEEIDQVHYSEVTDWAMRTTGCDKVLFFPGVQRNPEAARKNADYAPIEFAHSDYTEDYGAMIADPAHPYHRVLAPSMARASVSAADMQSLRRVLTLQLWRNTGPAVMDHPLAFCDARTVARAQLRAVRVESYGGVETQFDAFALLKTLGDNTNCWYTFPQMTPDEVVVFRAFDSQCAANKQAFWTPHSAFRDPHSSGVARHSIEMRAVCLFW